MAQLPLQINFALSAEMVALGPIPTLSPRYTFLGFNTDMGG